MHINFLASAVTAIHLRNPTDYRTYHLGKGHMEQGKKIILFRDNILTIFTAIIMLSLTSHSAVATQQSSEAATETLKTHQQATSSLGYLQEAEQKRRQFLVEKANTDNIAKQKIQKTNSVECQFWKQQKLSGKNANADEKVTQYCTI